MPLFASAILQVLNSDWTVPEHVKETADGQAVDGWDDLPTPVGPKNGVQEAAEDLAWKSQSRMKIKKHLQRPPSMPNYAQFQPFIPSKILYST